MASYKLIQKLKNKIPNKDAGEVLKGGSIALVYRVSTMFVSYALMWFISVKLGDVGIGIYNLSIAILGILVMAGCLGFNTSVVRFVSDYNSKKNYSHIKSLYLNILKITIPISLFLGALLYIFAETFALAAYNDKELITPFKIIALTLPLLVLTTINVEFIRGLKYVNVSEFFRNLSIQLINLTLVIISSFFVLKNHYPIIFYGVGVALSMLFTLGYILKYIRKQTSDIEKNTKDSPFSLKTYLIISLPMILTSFIQLINGKVDTLMIGFFNSMSVVGVFSVAFKLSIIVNFVLGSLKTIAMPKISELFWSNKMKELDKMVQFSAKLIFFFAFPISLLLFIFPEFILGLIDDSFVSGANTLRIFAVTQFIGASSGLVAVFLNMTGNQTFFTKLVLFATLANIGLNWWLIPKYGMEGAAWATLFSTVLWNVIGAVFIYKKYNIATFYNPFRK